jgi:hypothetical protein
MKTLNHKGEVVALEEMKKDLEFSITYHTKKLEQETMRLNALNKIEIE